MAKITLTNEIDRGRAEHGEPITIRRMEIDALVDTGATTLALPSDVVSALGLVPSGKAHVKMADGRRVELARVGVRVEILGRDTLCEAFVLPAGSTALIGQIPLEALDLIVDPKDREVRVNPESPEYPLFDLLAAS